MVFQKEQHRVIEKSCFISHRYTPDVVFLQELIPSYVQYLKKRAVSYLIIEGKFNIHKSIVLLMIGPMMSN